jgi:alginate biosynthesis protein AlgK
MTDPTPAFRSAPALALAIGLLAGPAQAAWLPDLGRGIAAMEAGDYAEAERNLRPLAQRSIVDAQIRLARLYAQRRQGTDLKQAIHWYWTALPHDKSVRLPLVRAILEDGSANTQTIALLREADEDGDPQALRMRLRLYRDMPGLASPDEARALAERAAESGQIEDASAAISWYGAQPDSPETLEAAAQLCRRWAERIDDCYGVMARQLRAAEDSSALGELVDEVASGHEQGMVDVEAVTSVARTLTAIERAGAPHPAAAYRLLNLVQTRSPEAKTRMARLLMDDATLDTERTPRELLEQALADGWTEAGLYLGRMHLDLQSADADPARAVDLLEQASDELPAAHFYLGRIYDDGYLGKADKQLALQEYLLAARGGYLKADLALAYLYWDNRGARVDPVNAYCFARIAMHTGVPGAAELVTTMRSRIEPALLERGQRKAEQEYEARRVAQRTTAPRLAEQLQAQLTESTP